MNAHLYDHCASQHGLLARQQALGAGMSEGEWRSLTRSAEWQQVYVGVYRRAGAPQSFEQTLMAGCLAVGGVASHRSAGVLWHLPDVEHYLELSIPTGRRAELRGFEIHRVARLPSVDRRHLQGIPVTSLARTVIDLSLEEPRKAPGLVGFVLAKRKVALPLLVNRVEALGTRGRKGAGDLRQLLQVYQGRQRHVDSGLQRRFEEIALQGYRAGRLPEPVFECPVLLSDGTWRYPDIGYPPFSVGFEAHSFEFHSDLESFAADHARNMDLFGEGWVIVPATEAQIRNPTRLVASMGRILMKHGWEGPA